MKSIKGMAVLLSVAISAVVLLTSCGSFSNISEEDAYNWGYYTGKAIGSMIDN